MKTFMVACSRVFSTRQCADRSLDDFYASRRCEIDGSARKRRRLQRRKRKRFRRLLRVGRLRDRCDGDMLGKASRLAGLSSTEKGQLEKSIRNRALVGIDAGSDPPIYRIARMNMYLHGDGAPTSSLLMRSTRALAWLGSAPMRWHFTSRT